MELTVDQENEVARQRKLTQTRERCRIFIEVFGPYGKPTPHGKVILDFLHTKFGAALPPNVLDKNDHTDEYQTWRRLGHFDVLETIRQATEWKEQSHVDTRGTGTE